MARGEINLQSVPIAVTEFLGLRIPFPSEVANHLQINRKGQNGIRRDE